MLIVSQKQIDVFKGNAFKNFEDEMVIHVKKYFPNHYNAMQENNVRLAIQYAYIKAKPYGFTSVRNVCLYINNMLLLGSNFDTDPQYPWAKEILIDKKEANLNLKIDHLSDKTLEQLSKVTGEGNIFIYRAILNFTKNAEQIFKQLSTSRLPDILNQLKLLFKQKYEVVGEANLNEMVKLATTSAKKYGVIHEGNIVIYCVFTFMMGSGFDNDPQFPWANEILNKAATDQNKKIELLYNTAIVNLQHAISTYSH